MQEEQTTIDFLRRFIRCFRDLHTTKDTFSFMVKGHLHCESVLSALLARALKRPGALDVERLEFQAKLNLCDALGLVPESLVPGLTKLGQFRNRLVHRLDYKVSEQDQTDFINMLRSTGGAHVKYYLSKQIEFPNGLRRCITGLLMDLSLQLAETQEQAKAMLVDLALLMHQVSGMEFDAFIAAMKDELRDVKLDDDA